MSSEWAPPEERPEPNELLRTIAELQAESDALPSDDFAGRHRLATEIDQLRTTLHTLTADALDAASDEWAERAGRKGEHEQNVEALEAMARIMTSEGSGGT